jgi:endonuclease/exonuclease/phosphatase family metal-dependent hydrolase
VLIKKLISTTLLALLSACGQSPPAAGAFYNPMGVSAPQNMDYAMLSQPGNAYNNSYDNSFNSSYGPASGAYPIPETAPTFNSNDRFASTPPTAWPSAAPSALPAVAPKATPPSAAPTTAPVPIPAQLKDATGELKILSYNVWGLPSLLGTDRKARFARLGQTLAGYDVVTLQETFSDDIDVLRQSTRYPYHLRWNNRGLRQGSGLYVLSRYPILRNEFKAFGNCTQADCLANKGVLFTRIDHPELGAIDIYTTHYQAEQNATAERIRIEEDNKVMQEFIAQNNSPYPTILTGDFNMQPDFPEYQDLTRRLPLTDVWRALRPTEPGHTSDPTNLYKKSDAQGKRIDYIFVLNQNTYKTTPLATEVTHNKPVEGYFLSDHFGVSAHLKFETLYSSELRNHPSQR